MELKVELKNPSIILMWAYIINKAVPIVISTAPAIVDFVGFSFKMMKLRIDVLSLGMCI